MDRVWRIALAVVLSALVVEVSCFRPPSSFPTWEVVLRLPVDTLLEVRAAAVAESMQLDQRGDTLYWVHRDTLTQVVFPPPLVINFAKGWPSELDSTRSALHSRLMLVHAGGRLVARNLPASAGGGLRVSVQVFFRDTTVYDTLRFQVPTGGPLDTTFDLAYDRLPVGPFDATVKVDSMDPSLVGVPLDTLAGFLEIPLSADLRGDTVVTFPQAIEIPQQVRDAADTTKVPNLGDLRLRLFFVNRLPVEVQTTVVLKPQNPGVQPPQYVALDHFTLPAGQIDSRGFAISPATETLVVHLPDSLRAYFQADTLYAEAEALIPPFVRPVFVADSDFVRVTGTLELALWVDPDSL